MKITKSIYIIITIFFSSVFYQTSFAQWFPTWEEMTIPKGFEFSGTGYSYLDVFFLKSNSNYGWISGHRSRVLRTTDRGKTWVGVIVEPSQSLQLESVMFLDEKVGYVSGGGSINNQSGFIYKTTNGGASWFSVTPSNMNSNLWGNYFYDKDNGISLGGDCAQQEFYKTTNGGTSWTRFFYNDNKFFDSKLADVIILDPNGLCYASGSGWIWRSLDGGRSWKPFSHTQIGASDWQEEMTFSNGSMLVPYSNGCYGATDTLFGGMRMSLDEGKTWKGFESKQPMFGAFLLSKTNGWAAGYAESMFYTCDGGLNWELMNCGIKNSSLDDIWFVNDTLGFVVGEKIYRTKNALENVNYVNHDTTYFCLGDSIKIISDTKYKKSKWNLCGFSKDVTVTSGGDYFQISYDSLICDIREIHKFPTKAYSVPNLVIKNYDLPKTSYCVGDSLRIGASELYKTYKWSTGDTTQFIIITATGKYFLNVTDSNGCKGKGTYDVVFNPLPKPKVIKGRTKFCLGDKSYLEADKDYSKIEWFESSSQNSINNSKLFETKNSGNYYYKAYNQFGCSSLSDSVSVIVRLDSNVFLYEISTQVSTNNTIKFDTTIGKQVFCKQIKVYNKSILPLNLDSINLFQRIAFSIPQSQLPKFIAPKDSIFLDICFSPTKIGKNYDTLLLNDNCTDHLVYLEGVGKGDKLIGDSKCKIPWTLQIINLGKNPLNYFSNPYPNPAGSLIYMDFVNYSKINYIELPILFNLYGQEVSKATIHDETNENIEDFRLTKGNLKFNLDNVVSGLYFIKYIENDEIKITPITISK